MLHALMGTFQLELLARRQKKLQHLTRPVKNVALTTKGLQERKHNLVIKINNSN